jgi:hypothetical protein
VSHVAHALGAVGVERGEQGTAGERQTVAPWPGLPVLTSSAQEPPDAEERLGEGLWGGTDGLVAEGFRPAVTASVSVVAMPRARPAI